MGVIIRFSQAIIYIITLNRSRAEPGFIYHDIDYWIDANLVIMILQIVLDSIIFKIMDLKNMKLFKVLSFILNFMIYPLSAWGVVLIYRSNGGGKLPETL